MKIIELLNRIANGEEVPKKIKYENKIYNYNYINKWYYKEGTILDLLLGINNLNDEVEIIEEHKIPEKISEYADINADIITKWSGNEEKLKNKINEIIDYLEENK